MKHFHLPNSPVGCEHMGVSWEIERMNAVLGYGGGFGHLACVYVGKHIGIFIIAFCDGNGRVR
ncbi:hypothetical protein SDC9_208618 [bioreactor metagenome]|uniref:Uncharacterized protein n=1 Tax=bioreactor metagenome TaxID=1076179 RepID=A0A645JB29_9ZZZZ